MQNAGEEQNQGGVDDSSSEVDGEEDEIDGEYGEEEEEEEINGGEPNRYHGTRAGASSGYSRFTH